MRSRKGALVILIIVALLSIHSSSMVLAKPGNGGGGKPGGGGGGKTLKQATVDITNPLDDSQFIEGNTFVVTATAICSKDTCKRTELTINVPTGLSLPNNDATHSLGTIDSTTPASTDWIVSADTAGNYLIDVTSTTTSKNSQPHSDNVSISISYVNQAPVADAGADQIVEDNDNNGLETVTLNGSASFDSDGSIVAYEWRDEGNLLGNGPVINIDFAVGAHNVTLKVTDNQGATDLDDVIITVNATPATYLSDDVEAGENGWTSTGLWHITERRSTSPTHSWWYGNVTTGTYETFAEGFVNGSNVSNMSTRNYGDLISPEIDLTAAVSPVLTFDSFWDTETSSSWDQKKVFIRTDSGASWVEIHKVCGCNSDSLLWEERSADLSDFAGNTVQIKFSFDTVDGVANNMEGWFLDNIEVSEG